MPDEARKWLGNWEYVFNPEHELLVHVRRLMTENEKLVDALEHCGYDPEDCIECGGPPCNETCRFWKLRDVLSYWETSDA